MDSMTATVETAELVAPIVIRNAEGALQLGKTALNVAKAGGATVALGAIFGGQLVLFGAGALGVLWGTKKVIDFGDGIYRNYKAKKAAKASEQTVPAPA